MRRFMQFRILRILSLKVIECHWWWCWRLMGKLVKRIWYERRSVAAWYLIFHRVLLMYRTRWFYLLYFSVLRVTLPSRNGILALSQSQVSQITKGIFLVFVHSNLTSQQASEEGSVVSWGGGWMLWQKQYFIPVNQLHAVRIKRTHFRTIHTPPPSSPSPVQSIARFRHVRITIATREWVNFH